MYLWNSTQNILPIPWKVRFFYNGENVRALTFKNSYAFLKQSLICYNHVIKKHDCQWNIRLLCIREDSPETYLNFNRIKTLLLRVSYSRFFISNIKFYIEYDIHKDVFTQIVHTYWTTKENLNLNKRNSVSFGRIFEGNLSNVIIPVPYLFCWPWRKAEYWR